MAAIFFSILFQGKITFFYGGRKMNHQLKYVCKKGYVHIFFSTDESLVSIGFVIFVPLPFPKVSLQDYIFNMIPN
jgi:hypothetical protein